MTMYRLLKNLSFGERLVRRGSIKRLGLDDEAIVILIEKRAIAPISSPPLGEIPFWSKRAAKLGELDILLVEHLLEADEKQVAKHMGVEAEAVQNWKKELTGWLQPAPLEPEGCCG